MTATRLMDRIEAFFEDNPGASVSTREGVARWRCTEHTLRETMRLLRARGVTIRCERVYRRRDQHTGRTHVATPVNEMLTQKLGAILARHVEPVFKPGVKLTIIARTPGNDDADVLVTNDDLDALSALIERSRAREEVKPPAGYTAEELERDNPFNAWLNS